MDALLLATKLRVPPQPQRAVRRARLIDALEQGIPHVTSSSCSRRRPAMARRRCWPSGRTRAASRSPGSRSARRTTTSSASSAICWRPGRRCSRASWRARWACSSARWRRTREAVLSAFINVASDATRPHGVRPRRLSPDRGRSHPPGADLPARPSAARRSTSCWPAAPSRRCRWPATARARSCWSLRAEDLQFSAGRDGGVLESADGARSRRMTRSLRCTPSWKAGSPASSWCRSPCAAHRAGGGYARRQRHGIASSPIT